jgi:hypothetical protein
VLMLAFRIEKLRVHLQGPFEAERLDSDQAFRIHLALLAPEDVRRWVDLPDAFFNCAQLGFLHEVDFVQQDAVRKG